MKKVIFLLVLVLSLSSCKIKEVVRYIEMPVVTVQKDSIYLYKVDSVVVYQKGDTIFKEKYKTIFKDKFKYKVDSVSVPIEVQVKVPVEKIIEKNVYVKDVF